MTELLTAAQMRSLEQAAIESGEVTGLELMERAGRGVVEAIFEEWPELAKVPHRAVVLCGPGNNGGDGFVVARLLQERGWGVDAWFVGHADRLPPDAATNYKRWSEANTVRLLPADGVVLDADHPDLYGLRAYDSEHVDVFVDALFGIGISRPISDKVAENSIMVLSGQIGGAETWPGNGFKTVAVDMPSGLCSDSGRILSEGKFPRVAPADLTVTFHKPKRGHHLGFGSVVCGVLRVVDLGLTERHARDAGLREPTGEIRGTRPIRTKNLPMTPGRGNSNDFKSVVKRSVHPGQGLAHKYSHGHALILSGGPGRTGAARLAARGTLRIGAGLVTIGCPQPALAEVAAQSTAVMVRALDGAPGLREMLEDDRVNALCLGPGLGLGSDTQTLVLTALGDDGVEPHPTGRGAIDGDAGVDPRHTKRSAVVLDADALTRFERNPETLFDALHDRCVLTPHGGEFRRLFPDIAEKLEAPATKGPAYSKVDATRAAAARAGCVVLFKGPDTVVADASGRCSINASVYERAAPWLATAGSGDVLAGFIAGLLARGFEPMEAAETGAWLHTECALSFGPGLIAEDLPEELPRVFSRLVAEAAEK